MSVRTLSFPLVTHVFKKYKELQFVKIMNEIYYSNLLHYCTCARRMTSTYVHMHIAQKMYNILAPITMKIYLKLNDYRE
jgi:hypothetical protein